MSLRISVCIALVLVATGAARSAEPAGPLGQLEFDAQGSLVGVAAGGGAKGTGAVLTLNNPDGRPSFRQEGFPQGLRPNIGGLTRLGTIWYGVGNPDATSYGSVITWAPGRGVRNVYVFTGGADGAHPQSRLVRMPGTGALFGVAPYGGDGQHGVVYSVDPGTNGANFQVVSRFAGGSDGANPTGRLLFDGPDRAYGTTLFGGAGGFGTVYRMDRLNGVWTRRTLYAFRSALDGFAPRAGLTADRDGVLFGTTSGGGANGLGTVFRLSPPTRPGRPWTKQTLWDFGGTDRKDGATPLEELVPDGRGGLLGVTAAGGSRGYGLVFQLTPRPGGQLPWRRTVVLDFDGTAESGCPRAPLTADGRGMFYGSTQGRLGYAGTNCGVIRDAGTLFRLENVRGTWTRTLLKRFR